MPLRNRSTLAAFDADAALEATSRVISGTLYSFCEYDTSSFRPLYVDDRTVRMYEDREGMLEHFERIHTHVHMDFMEIELVRNTLFPAADRVRYLTTALDATKILRVYVEDEGLFLALEPSEPVEPIVSAIERAVARPEKRNP